MSKQERKLKVLALLQETPGLTTFGVARKFGTWDRTGAYSALAECQREGLITATWIASGDPKAPPTREYRITQKGTEWAATQNDGGAD